MDGILLVDKSDGWTSHDVVAKVRGIIKSQTGQKVKVGHTGTLDPFATGLLVLVLGSYTKRASQFSELDKVYEAELTLGATSTTGDIEGRITAISPSTLLTRPSQKCSEQSEIDEKEIKKTLGSFVGEIEQVPPAFSAVKIGGQRAYKLARQGKDVKLEPRKVTVYSLQSTFYKYPILRLTASVSSGTYIRSLAQDIGSALGTGAYLSALRRARVGNFKAENALKTEDLTPENIRQHLQK